MEDFILLTERQLAKLNTHGFIAYLQELAMTTSLEVTGEMKDYVVNALDLDLSDETTIDQVRHDVVRLHFGCCGGACKK